MPNNKIKGLEVVCLTKVEAANLNSNGTEGVISVLKKVRDPVDMKEYVRISGQSVKYQLRQILRDMGKTLSPVISRQESGEKVIVSQGDPYQYIDDDLFGYMIAKKGKTLRRTAPVRTNGMISIFPYQEDRDFGVRYDPSESDEAKHNIYETEIATNIMRSNFFIEVDRVGVFESVEVENKGMLGPKDRIARISDLLSAIQTYHGGAHLSRCFTKAYPEIMVLVFLNKKIPVVGDNLRVKAEYSKSGKYILDVPLLAEVLNTFSDYIEKVYIALLKEKFENLSEIEKMRTEQNKLNGKIEVISLSELGAKIDTVLTEKNIE